MRFPLLCTMLILAPFRTKVSILQSEEGGSTWRRNKGEKEQCLDDRDGSGL